MHNTKRLPRPHLLAIAVATALGSAGPVAAKDDSQWYAGVLLQFDTVIKPAAVIGWRKANVDSDGKPSGVDIGVQFWTDGLHATRLQGFRGDRCLQGQLGVGYNFKKTTPLLTGGVHGNHWFAGVDFTLNDRALSPYVGLDTIGCYDSDKPVAPPDGYGEF
ncbi:hypothetical protein MOJ79_06095 [Calidifontimicrobium sp. SYSU G02091]|uniref:hypothetical protein n=1 Tax=Calidifontimicrobium sp. SYSU G02091 TaxID=2926421 RepID=UPI001F52DFC5|nr:hypothetical protein [Calidifontimicrobium sp. SYSU G02091]MCI1191408.1 hypothetical protein [Calidifontimicrobium sp. SYSU G02091]